MDKINKKIRYSGIQPQYFPRLHYFARIISADVFVLRDDAQFVRKHKYPDGSTDKSYQAHTPIKQASGRQLLFVTTKHDGFLPLTKTKISYEKNWAIDHLKTLQIAYAQTPFFKNFIKELEVILDKKYSSLSELNTATIIWGLLHLLDEKFSENKLNLRYINEKLGKNKLFRLKEIRKASGSRALKNKNLSTNEKIIALCREIGATEDYCGGTGAAAYMSDDLFSKNDIKISVQDWKCTEYPQQFSRRQGFIPDLSILDLLFNVKASDARRILS